MNKISKRHKAKLSHAFRSERVFLKNHGEVGTFSLVLRRSRPFTYEDVKIPMFCFINMV